MSVLPRESLVRTLRAVCHAAPFRAAARPTPHAHPGLRRAGTTALVLGLAAALTGCGAQGQGMAAPEVTDALPREGGTSPSVTPAPGAAPTTGPGTCFDVVEVYTGLVLLPITPDTASADAHGAGDEAGAVAPGASARMAEAEESVRSHRDQLPAAVRPAFDQAVRLLQNAGESLQPQEAAHLQRSLEPVESWISEQCSAAVPGE